MSVATVDCCRVCSKPQPPPSCSETLFKCSRCMITLYCSQECQRADWGAHKVACYRVGIGKAIVEKDSEFRVEVDQLMNRLKSRDPTELIDMATLEKTIKLIDGQIKTYEAMKAIAKTPSHIEEAERNIAEAKKLRQVLAV